MLAIFRALMGRPAPAPQQAQRPRLHAAEWPAVVYAIGDIHGCYDQLVALERQIADDARAIAGERWIVTLGDYIDRGPQSARVVSHLMKPLDGFKRIALAGNHEQMMLGFLADPVGNAQWLEFGGLDTALSYGLRQRTSPAGSRWLRGVATDLASLIPEAHLQFLSHLPVSLSLPGYQFVHAGMRPGIPAGEQAEDDLLWIREPFLEGGGIEGEIVVHGHTPELEPQLRPWRIGIDTGAFAGGPLTAVRLQRGLPPAFLGALA